MSFVGIDVGGTFVKACSWSLETGVSEVIREPVPQFTTAFPEREFDPSALVRSCRDVLQKAIDQVGCQVDQIFLTGQMGGLVLVDRRNPNGTRAISWQDERFSPRPELVEFEQGFGLPVIGDPPRIGHPIVVLDHLRPTSQVRVESVLSYLAGRLCDQSRGVIHLTDAAALGLCAIRRGAWSMDGLRFLGISTTQMPEIVDELVSVGNTAQGISLSCGIGDQQSSLFGVGLEKHEISVNLATGCQVSRIEDSPRSEIQTRPYFFGDFLQTITHLPAGRLLSNAVSRCGLDIHEANSWQVAEEMSRTERSNEVKSACEQIAMSICSAIDRIRSQSVSNIVFSGGVAQKFPAIRRIVETKTRMDSRVFDGDDAALAGLRRLSQIA